MKVSMPNPGDLVLIKKVPKRHHVDFHKLVGKIVTVEEILERKDGYCSYSSGAPTEEEYPGTHHIVIKDDAYHGVWIPVEFLELVFTI